MDWNYPKTHDCLDNIQSGNNNSVGRELTKTHQPVWEGLKQSRAQSVQLLFLCFMLGHSSAKLA